MLAPFVIQLNVAPDDEDSQHRGHGTAVVAGWAAAVQRLGRVPLYGTSWDNVASQGVARKLGLVCFGAGFSIT